MTKFHLFLCATSMLLGALPAQAALISTDTAFGAGTATLDTATNLLWLDHDVPLRFPITSDDTGDGDGAQSASYIETSDELLPGGRLAGWRYATVGEVNSFFANSGAVTGPTAETDFFAFQNLIGAFSIDVSGTGRSLSIRALVGGTSPTTSDNNGDGLLDNLVTAQFLDIDRQDPTNPDGNIFTFTATGALFDWQSLPSGGGGFGLPLRVGSHWLVRSADTAVPEPISAAFLALGLGGLAWQRRNRLSQKP